MSPQIKTRISGAWVDVGGPTHAKIAGVMESVVSAVAAEPPVFRTQTAAVANGGPTVSVTIPVAVEVGDCMVIAAHTEKDTTIATPAGWTLVRRDQSVAGDYPNWTYIFRKFAVGGDVGGSTVVTLTTSVND